MRLQQELEGTQPRRWEGKKEGYRRSVSSLAAMPQQLPTPLAADQHARSSRKFGCGLMAGGVTPRNQAYPMAG